MKVTTEKPETGVAALTVEVPPEEFDRAIDQAWRRVANRVNIPGFRRGKAPRPLVERHVGPAAINEEALRRLLPERYDAAVEETGIAPIERPAFDVVQLERGKPLVFKATVAVQPTVEPGDLQSITVEPQTVDVGQEEVDRVLERLRGGQAQWLPVEDRGLEMGDQAIADVTVEFPAEDDRPSRKTERKDSEVVLGENAYPDGFDREMLGARPGETREFAVTWGTSAPVASENVAEQEGEGQAEGEGEREGASESEAEGEEGSQQGLQSQALQSQGPVAPSLAAAATSNFTVTLKDVKRKQLPDLDDDFAKSLGEFESLSALTESVRSRLVAEAVQTARVTTENRAVDAAIEKSTFEIPERLIEAETDALAQDRRQTLTNQGITLERYLPLIGQSEADWRAELRLQAARQVRARVLLDALVEREGLDVAPDEIEDEVERTAQGYGPQADEVRRALMTQESRRRIATSLRRHKAIETLVAYAGGYPATPEVSAAPAGSAAPEPEAAEGAPPALASTTDPEPEAPEDAPPAPAGSAAPGPVAPEG